MWPLSPKTRTVHAVNTTVKVTEGSDKDKMTIQKIMAKFNAGKTQSVRHIRNKKMVAKL